MKSNKLHGIHARWQCRLAEFDAEIVYRPGSANLADAPSRMPLPDVDDDWDNFKSDVDYASAERPVVRLARLLCQESFGDSWECDDNAVIEDDALPSPGFIARRTRVTEWPDIWDDEATMAYIMNGDLPDLESMAARRKETARVKRRALAYRWKDDGLYFLTPTGSEKLVPRPVEREELVQQAHALAAHMGVRKTVSLLSQDYYWHNLWATVEKECGACQQCKRRNAQFTAKSPQLHPLPRVARMHRVHCDLCGPFLTKDGKDTYVMVMVDSFTKWVELALLKGKTAAGVRDAFRDSWLTRYGAMAVALTDNGSEFAGEFEALLWEAGITHRFTSPDHPQSNGLAERMVQVVKTAISKFVDQLENPTSWPSHLQWIAMAYRFTRQESTGFSPYRLMFGCDPVVPLPTRSVVLDESLNYDDVNLALEVLLRKMEALRRDMPYALGNLDAAAERDSLRYENRRTGVYKPSKNHWFRVKDLVYVAQRRESTLDARAGSSIYRVVQVRQKSILVLQGRNGLTFHVNGTKAALCHLTTIDPCVDRAMALERFEKSNKADTVCELCDERYSAYETHRAYNVLDEMILCDYCLTGWHVRCLGLTQVPENDFICEYCQPFRREMEYQYSVTDRGGELGIASSHPTTSDYATAVTT